MKTKGRTMTAREDRRGRTRMDVMQLAPQPMRLASAFRPSPLWAPPLFFLHPFLSASTTPSSLLPSPSFPLPPPTSSLFHPLPPLYLHLPFTMQATVQASHKPPKRSRAGLKKAGENAVNVKKASDASGSSRRVALACDASGRRSAGLFQRAQSDR